ncbi:uncharacterized protein LOC142357271 [Convolutriloba macropyga]|uniref:uncharacterized protein LOC142357271 n=1 Tax=Convolutriloba macropyga TaxID=536237 RepID=UPI003F51BBBF
MSHLRAIDSSNAVRPVLQCGRSAAGLALPAFRPAVMGRSRNCVPLIRGQGGRSVAASAIIQDSEADIDEEAIMRMAESLPPEDRGKALKLWEENKRMRNKLAILESVTELPADQRFRALDLLKENRTLRNTTGSLLQTWDSLKDTVAALSLTMESEVNMAAPTDTAGMENGEEVEEEWPEFDPDWSFWEAGLGSQGTLDLVTADGALQLALVKAEVMADSEVDEILNRYWQAELAPLNRPAPAEVEAAKDVPSVTSMIAESVAEVEAAPAPSVIEAAAEMPAETVDAEAEEAEAEEAGEAGAEEAAVANPEPVVASRESEDPMAAEVPEDSEEMQEMAPEEEPVVVAQEAEEVVPTEAAEAPQESRDVVEEEEVAKTGCGRRSTGGRS